MKIKNVRFLAKANIKGNKKSNSILITMLILVISLTLISSYAITITNAMNENKRDFNSRLLEVDPWQKELTEDVIESIKNVEHVENIYPLKGMRNQNFDVLNVSDENGINKEIQQQLTDKGSYICAWSLKGDEKRSVIAGKSLDESPTFSCIIPSLFYPFDDYYDEVNGNKNNLEYIDGESLIGKTLTLIASGGEYFEALYNYFEEPIGGNEWLHLPALEYKMKIVGVYYSSPTSDGYYNDIFVSEETGRLIMEKELAASNIDLSDKNSDVAKWWNTPSLRTHYLLVDDYDNIPYVYDQLTDMGIDCADMPELGIRGGTVLISSILSIAGVFLVFSTAILCMINLIQSTTSSLKIRRGEIGLLKAVGYKNSQIFACLCYEHLSLTVKAFIIGGGISAIFIAVSNFINNHRTYVDRLYIVRWSDYLIFLAISFCAALIVPLICQLIVLHKLAKIQPKDAMG